MQNKMLEIDDSKKLPEKSPFPQAGFLFKSTGREAIKFVVLHHTGSAEINSINEALETYKKYGVSAHYIIDENGKIFKLVDEEDIAFHAGSSYWRDCKDLNKSSIGIELFNSSPFDKKFSQQQMHSLLQLLRHLIAKYNLDLQNIVGHSDIACNLDTLNRKQDPSHLFDWKFLAENNAAIAKKLATTNENILYKKGDQNEKIKEVKKNLAAFGYLVDNLESPIFDDKFEQLAIVFNRRFNQAEYAFWGFQSQAALDEIMQQIKR